MKVRRHEIELNDKQIVKGIKSALKDYQDGAVVEARDTLKDIIRALNDFIRQEEGW